MQAINIFSDKKQYFTSLPVGVLNVDISYQKPLSMAHVKKIIKNFDPMGVGQIHVSKRKDGTFWVFDGQHRAAAYREMGFKNIDCIVYEGLTIEEESKGYVYYNNTMKQTQLQKFKAELLAGVSEAIDINNIVKISGLGIDINGAGEPIRAVGAIRNIYSKHNRDDLRDVLEVLRDSFGNSKDAYQSYIISGVHQFLKDYKKNKKFDKSWLINRYKKFGIAELISQTNTFYAVHKGSKKDAVGLASVKMYNYNKSKDKKL